MIVINYSDFRANMKENLNAVNENKEVVVVSRSKGKNVVVMDMDEYNSVQETLHLTGNSVNRKRLSEAISEMTKGKSVRHKLIEK